MLRGFRFETIALNRNNMDTENYYKVNAAPYSPKAFLTL